MCTNNNSTLHDYQVLLSAVRQNFASVVWTHKIQEKQADIYIKSYQRWQTANMFLASLTSCGIVAVIFAGDAYQLVLKLISALLSFGTIFITAYLKTFDLKELAKRHKETANQFLVIRNDLLQVIADLYIHQRDIKEIRNQYDEIMQHLNNLYTTAPPTTEEAVKKAGIALGPKEEYTYADKEIDRFLPKWLRGDIEH